ncbi:MAG: hypothetical protein MHPSP_003411, partial [Paramarteilia canceri]
SMSAITEPKMTETSELKVQNSISEQKVFCKLHTAEAKAPVRGTEDSAGSDLFSIDTVTVPARESVAIKTGISLSIPEGRFY